MKITATKTFREKGKTLTKVTLSLGPVARYNPEDIEGFSQRLSLIVNRHKTTPDDGILPVNGSGFAELLARTALQIQAGCGLSHTYWKVEKGTDVLYEVYFSCENEAVGEYAARAAYRIIRSALYRQRYSIAPDLAMLKTLGTSGAVYTLQRQPVSAWAV